MQTDIDPNLLSEAADWLMRFQCGEAVKGEQFERWRATSPQHALAWQRAESILQAFGQLPSGVGRGVLGRLGHRRRREALQLLGVALLAPPMAWLAWRQLPWRDWSADLRTAIGEQRRIGLADGTQLVLNTASAVDVSFSDNERRLRLHAGEILVTTGHAPSPVPRPFFVDTAQGRIRALGTRFVVRQLDEMTRVSVLESAVEVRPRCSNDVARLDAGDSADFGKSVVSTRVHDHAAATWEQGMLVARSLRLGELIAELDRYRSGVLRCDPRVAGLPVSGAFSLRDVDASLALLEQTLPVKVVGRTRYWRVIEPR